MPETLPVTEEITGPRVSAVIVSFNQAAQLRRSIAALENSSGRERLEIVVVDCGSQDESPKLDAEFPAVNMLRLPHHFGAVKAMNIAIRTAKADLVFFLSPNVEVQPDTITKLAGLLEQESDLSGACPLLVDPEGKPVSDARPLPTSGNLYPAPQELDLNQESIAIQYPGLDALLVRKQFIRGMNYFDGRYGDSWADADLAMQIRRAGKKIRLYPGIRATVHPSPNALQGDPLAEADRILGAAAYLGKYYGFLSGLSFRLIAILKTLGRFDFRLLGYLISGQKLDGSQAG
ncbi:MAG: glycosyltransferase [Bryobacterales bacterium]|nr:glycosyltransferase [Bryobacterales bacterium]MBV9399732.1 glycosyltransferase [Bryobacterales bacterium]